LSEHLLIKFSFDAKGGNNFYLDNINLGSASVLGLPNLTKEDVLMYPNPVESVLHIEVANTSAIQILVRDLNGKELLLPIREFQEQIEISTASWAAGVYFVTLISNGISETWKVVK